jgi:PPOX class probable F420-dependent enzyme
MTASLSEAARAVFDAPVFATLATLNPDGQPQLSVVWVSRDGDDLLVSTVEGRRKHLNLVRDPRATVLAVNPENPYSYVEVRGTASLTLEGGRELIDAHARHYTGADRYGMDDGTDNVRVVVRITPTKVVAY